MPSMVTFPVDVEVGCGVGKHSIEFCSRNPDRTLIAIDKSRIRMGKLIEKVNSLGGLSNFFPIRENATWFITHQIPSESVENYFFLYPNPYPKKAQANKRWYRMPFMSHVIDTMKTGGLLHIATNMKYYSEESEEWMTSCWKLTLVEKKAYQEANAPFSPRTHFEKKYLERGQTCWNLVFKKDFPVSQNTKRP